jgi:hypothetical protein
MARIPWMSEKLKKAVLEELVVGPLRLQASVPVVRLAVLMLPDTVIVTSAPTCSYLNFRSDA